MDANSFNVFWQIIARMWGVEEEALQMLSKKGKIIATVRRE
ncbi:MAG: hypothetical protein ACXV5H_03270 [Halobacteriota archaeon]